MVLVSACISLSAATFDPLDSHGGIFRPLDLSPSQLMLVSRLHATASYHELFDFITVSCPPFADNPLVFQERLLMTPAVTFEEKKRIEKFLLKNRPPTAIKNFLDDADRNYVSQRTEDVGEEDDPGDNPLPYQRGSFQIAVLHANGDIPESMGVVEQAIFRLPKTERRKVVEYIWKKPEPFMLEHFGLES